MILEPLEPVELSTFLGLQSIFPQQLIHLFLAGSKIVVCINVILKDVMK